MEEPQAGIWYVLLDPINYSFESVNLTASYIESDEAQITLLENNRPIFDLEGKRNTQLMYAIDIPQDSSNLNLSINGGSGDADLYVLHGEAPSEIKFECRPWLNGNNETCFIDQVKAGRYFIMVHAFTNFSGVTLEGSFEEANEIGDSSMKISNLTATTGEWLHFEIEIPNGMAQLNVDLVGGSGDADLYVRRGEKASSTRYDCRPYLYGNSESCQFDQPKSGSWYISLRAFSVFSGVELNAKWEQ